MKSVSSRIFVLVVAAVVLLACGKTLNESERSYAEACIKINDKLNSKGEANRKLCECTATIVVPKLTPGELNAYVNSVDLMGKVMTPEVIAARGFTLTDFTNLGVKRQALFPEMRKTCGGESF
jgi:hypothetical protein